MTVAELIAELGRQDLQDEVRIWDVEKGYDDPDNFNFECHHAKPITDIRRMDLCIGGKLGIVIFKEGDQE